MEKKPKHPGGRPLKTFDPKLVEDLYAKASTDEDVSVALKVNSDTICEWKSKRAEFQEAMRIGQSRARMSLRSWMFQKAQEGNTTMQIWLSKQICGYRDNPSVDVNVKSTFADAIVALSEHKG